MKNDLEEIASFVHGTLAGLHLLGVLYNAKRGNWWSVAIHASVFVFDTKSAIEHAKETKICPLKPFNR